MLLTIVLADKALFINPAEIFVENDLVIENTDSRAPTVSVVFEVGFREI